MGLSSLPGRSRSPIEAPGSCLRRPAIGRAPINDCHKAGLDSLRERFATPAGLPLTALARALMTSGPSPALTSARGHPPMRSSSSRGATRTGPRRGLPLAVRQKSSKALKRAAHLKLAREHVHQSGTSPQVFRCLQRCRHALGAAGIGSHRHAPHRGSAAAGILHRPGPMVGGDRSAGPDHPHHLAHALQRVRHEEEHQSHRGSIDACIRQRQVLGVAFQKANPGVGHPPARIASVGPAQGRRRPPSPEADALPTPG